MASIDFPNSPAVNDVFTAGNSSYRWTGAAWVSNNLNETLDWDSLGGKPTEFPPSAHTHVIADTTGLQTALDGKAATSHTHAINQVINLPESLAGKADAGHTHVKANITDFAHTHSMADITDYVAPDSLPSQSGNGGKYLTTNGSAASWATITTDPTPTVFLMMGA